MDPYAMRIVRRGTHNSQVLFFAQNPLLKFVCRDKFRQGFTTKRPSVLVRFFMAVYHTLRDPELRQGY
jgi:chromosome condensin MukBEF ATPase and DNA-binding subunit MukB